MNYLQRTTPAAMCGSAATIFDTAVHAAISQLTGFHLDASQWEQAGFAIRDGGLGLRAAVANADAAYLGSRAATRERCEAIRVGHRWDGQIPGSWISAATARCNEVLGHAGTAGRIHSDQHASTQTQTQVGQLVDAARVVLWEQSVPADAKCRRHAYAGPVAGKVLLATPSQTLDKHLSTAEFNLEVALRLGVDVFEGGSPRPFRGLLLDTPGRHALSCMAGGDAVFLHNSVRDLVYDFCRRGRLRPALEANDLLQGFSLPDGRRRPADVLLCATSALPAGLPDGSRMPSNRRVALDFAVINALGPSHWQATFHSIGEAASAYAEHKRRHLNTASLCEEAGLVFQPVVLTAQGAVTKEAAALFHRIAEAVSAAEGSSPARLYEDLLERLAVLTSRANGRAVARRLLQVGVDAPLAGAAMAQNLLRDPADF